MKLLCVLGPFAENKDISCGQEAKVNNIYKEITVVFSEDNIYRINTDKSLLNIILLPFRLFCGLLICRNFLMLPSKKGIKVTTPFVILFNFFLKRKLFYSVIGGWLKEFLVYNPLLKRMLLKFDGIFVETTTMGKQLKEIGFNNIIIMPNFKRLSIISDDYCSTTIMKPYKVCTFSRVDRKKGIEDAVKVVNDINREYGNDIYNLDIYGIVEKGQEEWFEKLKMQFNSNIKYLGLIDSEKTTEVLKNYFCLLFPTHYYTEGLPGTIIDAFSSGIPVVSSKWESFEDVIDDGVNGFGYEINDISEMKSILKRLAENPDVVLKMKSQCIKKARKYLPEEAIKILTREFAYE